MYTDPEELYNSLVGYLEGQGYNVTEKADTLVASLAEELVAPGNCALVDLENERGPNDRWQCYTREANDAMEALFQQLAVDLTGGVVTRNMLPSVINARVNELEKNLSEQGGVWDTEPQVALATRLNPVLDELGYKSVSRWEW